MKKTILLLLIQLFGVVLHAQVNLSMPDTVISRELEQLMIPVKISDIGEDDIYGFSLELGFDPEVISITGFSQENTLSPSFLIFDNAGNYGLYLISGAGSEAIGHEGVLIVLELAILDTGSTTLEFSQVKLNEGSPAVNPTDGLIKIVQPPASPDLQSPKTEGLVEKDLTLLWSAEPTAKEYNIQVSTNSNFDVLVMNQQLETNEIALSTLDFDTQYYWRVRTQNELGYSNWSGSRSFTTRKQIPGAPSLIGPEDVAGDQSTELSLIWSQSARADSFRVQVSLQDDFTSLMTDSVVTDSILFVSGLDFLQTYYWRIKGLNNGGESEWSEAFSFTVMEKPNTFPIVSSPLGKRILSEDFDEFIIAKLDTVFSDLESNSLNYEIQILDEEILRIGLNGGQLRLIPIENSYGNTEIIVKATDGNQASVFDTLTITVESVNDLPYIGELPDTVVFIAGEIYKLEGLLDLIGDIENQINDLILSIELESNFDLLATLDQTEGSVTITGEVGTGILKIKVTDQDGGEATASVQIEVILLESSEDQPAIAEKVTLSQNYPNPFNPSTIISFTLPQYSEVSLKVFDLAGRQVITVIDKRMGAGKHSVSFDASKLTSGIYFYRLVTSGFTETKQMMLIK